MSAEKEGGEHDQAEDDPDARPERLARLDVGDDEPDDEGHRQRRRRDEDREHDRESEGAAVGEQVGEELTDGRARTVGGASCHPAILLGAGWTSR